MSPRAPFWIVIAAAAVLLTSSSGFVPLLDPDESRFARTSVEMMRSRDVVVPQFEGQPRLVKPPLFHWVQSSLFRGLGVTEWVARLTSTAATLGSMLILGWIARRRFGDEAAVWAGLILVTMPLVAVEGYVGTLDALLALHVLAVLALDMAGTRDEAGSHRALAIGGLLGLAFLIKGPIGVILPLLAMLAGRTADRRTVLPMWRNAMQSAAAWCLVVLPWSLALLKRVGLDAVTETLHGEALERFIGGTTHVEPWWHYAAVVALGFLPWGAPLLVGIVRAFARRGDPAARTGLYAAAGLVAGLLFLSLSKGKLPSYILPLAPLAAIVVTWELGEELRQPGRRVRGSVLVALTLVVFAAALGYGAATRLEGTVRLAAWIGAAVYSAGAVVSGWAAAARRARAAYAAAGITALVFLFVAVWLLMPAISRTRTARHLIDAVPELSTARPLAVVDMKVPSLTFYLDRIPEQIDMRLLEERLEGEEDLLLVFDEVDLDAAPATAMARLRELGRQGKYVVYETIGSASAPGD